MARVLPGRLKKPDDPMFSSGPQIISPLGFRKSTSSSQNNTAGDLLILLKAIEQELSQVSDKEFIKSFWLSLRAEEIALYDAREYPDERDYENADFEWLHFYDAYDFDNGLPDDPLIDEAVKLILQNYGRNLA